MTTPDSIFEDCAGLPIGKLDPDRKWEAAIIIQGPYLIPQTQQVVRIFLERNSPSVLVIVAFTSDTASAACDVQDHTGRVVYLPVRTPSAEESPEFWRSNMRNQNRQRLSSFIGIRFAQNLGIPFVLKCRSDAFLGMPNVCQYLRAFSRVEMMTGSARRPQPRMRGRIVVSDHTRSETYHLTHPDAGPYHVADMWLFGHTEDLINYFDVRSGSAWWRDIQEGEGRDRPSQFAVETNFVEMWMRNIGLPRPACGLGELAGRYLAVVDSVVVEFVWLRGDDSFALWNRHGRRFVIDTNGLYMRERMSHARWAQLSEEYSRPPATPFIEGIAEKVELTEK